jgi:hypothetical protein
MYEDNIGNFALVYLVCAVLATRPCNDIYIANRMALAIAVQNSRL